jgi:hypothetical protein
MSDIFKLIFKGSQYKNILKNKIITSHNTIPFEFLSFHVHFLFNSLSEMNLIDIWVMYSDNHDEKILNMES